jgi:signal peptidase I
MNPEPVLPEEAPAAKPASRLRAIAVETLQTIVLAGAFYIAISLLTARVVVEGPSMRPTLVSGEWIVVNRLTYRLGRAQRGDVIVFLPPTNAQTDDLIKRVIGLPAETLEIRDGAVWIDGRRLEETYAAGTTSPDNRWVLSEDELFVMGDNRGLSLDSRSFGPISLKNVVGRAWIIYWPPSEWGPLEWRIKAAAPEAAPAQTASFQYNILLRFPGCRGLSLSPETRTGGIDL